MALIKTRGIEKSYKTGAGETFVLRRIDLEIGAGDFVTIMGPSGAGKSTLLSILGMLDGDWRGEYWLGDEPVHAMRPRSRIELNKRYIGFVFQQYHLLDDLSVYENIEIPLSYRNVKRQERQAIVADSLDRFPDRGEEGPLSDPALWRSAAARRCSPGRHRRAEGDPGRRAHGQPPLEPGPHDHGSPGPAQR